MHKDKLILAIAIVAVIIFVLAAIRNICPTIGNPTAVCKFLSSEPPQQEERIPVIDSNMNFNQ